MTKIFVVYSLARMIHGEWVFVKSERAFENEAAAKDFAYVLKAQYSKDGNAIPINLQTEHGEVACFMEVGVAETDLEKG